MAGSRKWMVYEADNSSQYAVQIDESNGEAADFDDYDSVAVSSNVQPLPSSIKMRYCNVRDPVSGATRQIYVGKPSSGLVSGVIQSLLLWAFSGNSAGAAIAWSIASYVGERVNQRRPSATDSGFTDGDNT